MRFTSGQQDGEEPPFSICKCVDLRVAPSARTANSLLLLPPFPPEAERCALTCVESIICVSRRAAAPSKLPEQVFPDATPRPAHKAIIDRCRRTIFGRAITPATAAFQHMHNAADDAAIIRPFDAPYIRRQMRFYPLPLLIAQPKQVPAHGPIPRKTNHALWNQDCLGCAADLMSSDPSQRAYDSSVTAIQSLAA